MPNLNNDSRTGSHFHSDPDRGWTEHEASLERKERREEREERFATHETLEEN